MPCSAVLAAVCVQDQSQSIVWPAHTVSIARQGDTLHAVQAETHTVGWVVTYTLQILDNTTRRYWTGVVGGIIVPVLILSQGQGLAQPEYH